DAPHFPTPRVGAGWRSPCKIFERYPALVAGKESYEGPRPWRNSHRGANGGNKKQIPQPSTTPRERKTRYGSEAQERRTRSRTRGEGTRRDNFQRKPLEQKSRRYSEG